jgi:hypothetical protein
MTGAPTVPGRSKAFLYNTARPHLSLGYGPPAPDRMWCYGRLGSLKIATQTTTVVAAKPALH